MFLLLSSWWCCRGDVCFAGVYTMSDDAAESGEGVTGSVDTDAILGRKDKSPSSRRLLGHLPSLSLKPLPFSHPRDQIQKLLCISSLSPFSVSDFYFFFSPAVTNIQLPVQLVASRNAIASLSKVTRSKKKERIMFFLLSFLHISPRPQYMSTTMHCVHSLPPCAAQICMPHGWRMFPLILKDDNSDIFHLLLQVWS